MTSILNELGLVVTAIEPDEMPLVWSNWMNCSYDSELGRKVGKRHFMPMQKARINAILARPETEILVLRSIEFPMVIDGWVCTTGDHLNFQYLKPSRRKMGLGTALLEQAGELKTYGFQRLPWSSWYDRRGITYKAGAADALPLGDEE